MRNSSHAQGRLQPPEMYCILLAPSVESEAVRLQNVHCERETLRPGLLLPQCMMWLQVISLPVVDWANLPQERPLSLGR